jgi:hypothetical protein
MNVQGQAGARFGRCATVSPRCPARDLPPGPADLEQPGPHARRKTLSGAVRQDMRYLAPTPRNIGKANVAVPAGFRRLPDGSFGGPVFQVFGANIPPGS